MSGQVSGVDKSQNKHRSPAHDVRRTEMLISSLMQQHLQEIAMEFMRSSLTAVATALPLIMSWPQNAAAQENPAAAPVPQVVFPSFWPWNISGTWDFISNNVEGTLTIQQESNSSRCRRITGILNALDVNPIVGVYCPTSLRIIFTRYVEGEGGPVQIYEGYVSD
ncbi:hypothetical protein [Azohydromonas lata]|uniref:Uncharacterized protein n=1 Tax=Azohydromonas lata TaxID=45677 RepID=A0ABU5IQ67_9BURK|nr:hypothetical protein [Azohydromonas lata]MDZ5461025.1 hypothetical protein [Azohydromonas lata]